MSNRIAIATLRGQLRLIGAGMTIRGLSKTKALDVAGNVTGKTYKRGEHKKAAEDVDQWLKRDFAQANSRDIADLMVLRYDLEVDPVDMVFDELVRDPNQDIEAMQHDIAMKVSFP